MVLRALLLVFVVIPGVADARWRRACASNGLSCSPGPCCPGTRCVEGVCRKPEKEWSDGQNPKEPTPDSPRPLKTDAPAPRKR